VIKLQFYAEYLTEENVSRSKVLFGIPVHHIFFGNEHFFINSWFMPAVRSDKRSRDRHIHIW
jgi:hypothetical protein